LRNSPKIVAQIFATDCDTIISIKLLPKSVFLKKIKSFCPD
jgi:hypothetical protein